MQGTIDAGRVAPCTETGGSPRAGVYHTEAFWSRNGRGYYGLITGVRARMRWADHEWNVSGVRSLG